MSFHRSAFQQINEAVANETITTFVRCVSFSVAISFGFMSYGPLVNADSPAYDNPVFEGAFYFARPEAWGTGFGAGALLMLLAALTGRAWIYLTAVVVTSVTLMGWASMIALEAWIDPDAFLSLGAYGLYLMSFTTIIGMALSPQQFEGQTPVAVVTERDDVIQLRRTS